MSDWKHEEKLLAAMAGIVQQLVIAPETIDWLAAAVADSDTTEAGARDKAVRQFKAERDRLQAGIDTRCLDRLDRRSRRSSSMRSPKNRREQQKQVDGKLAACHNRLADRR